MRLWLSAQFALLVTPDEAGGGPGCDGGADWPMGPAVGHVRRQSGHDAQGQQPAGQVWHGQPMPGRVQNHHRGGVHQPVDSGRFQARCHPALAVNADHLQACWYETYAAMPATPRTATAVEKRIARSAALTGQPPASQTCGR